MDNAQAAQVDKAGKPPKDKDKEEEDMQGKANGGKLQAGLTSLVERATSALNMVKEGKITPQVFASLAAMERDLKSLREKYPSPKAAREFTEDEFNKFVADETQAILAESDPLIKSMRTQALGESVADFRKAFPSNAEDKASQKVKVQVFTDPAQRTQEGPAKVPLQGSPGKPTHAMKGEGADDPPAQDPPAEEDQVNKGDPNDPVDDGKWSMDMGGGVDHPNPAVSFGKRKVDEPRRIGAVGDMNAQADTDQK